MKRCDLVLCKAETGRIVDIVPEQRVDFVGVQCARHISQVCWGAESKAYNLSKYGVSKRPIQTA